MLFSHKLTPLTRIWAKIYPKIWQDSWKRTIFLENGSFYTLNTIPEFPFQSKSKTKTNNFYFLFSWSCILTVLYLTAPPPVQFMIRNNMITFLFRENISVSNLSILLFLVNAIHVFNLSLKLALDARSSEVSVPTAASSKLRWPNRTK